MRTQANIPANLEDLTCGLRMCRLIKRGQAHDGIELFEKECLKWPGFIEFDDVNCKVLTYSAVNKCGANSKHAP